MATRTYIQIFSMTDHAKGFDRYSGPYQGLNSKLQTAEVRDGQILISSETKSQTGHVDQSAIQRAKALLSYRHTDTGELSGTSEMLIPIQTIPWTEMPGLELKSISKNEAVIKLWNQDLKLKVNKVLCVRFMKTIAYIKNFGAIENVSFTDEELKKGPAHLHAEVVDQELTLAPPSPSGLQVKMGQETES